VGRELQLAGQTLLVIGGSSGIGLEVARRARGEGASLIITARDPERVHRAGLELEASIAAFDATDFPRLDRFIGELPTPIDHVLVTGPRPRRAPLPTFQVEDARRDVDGHLLLPLEVACAAASVLRPSGSLVLTGCTAPAPAGDGPTFVSALTAALSAMTKSLAHELAPVRVNLIAAGFVAPADAAALAVHLMTNAAVTGATFEINGVQPVAEGEAVTGVPGTRPGSHTGAMLGPGGRAYGAGAAQERRTQ
jgi:NAD(P)-dependent dehydrogenase (short-subunit alcohol dehydrogenase family)